MSARGGAGPPGGTGRLVVLRHGQSEWNARNLFTGWVNAALTADGEQEAIRAGRLLAEHELFPGVVHTSVQRRAIRTADLALTQCDRDWVPVHRSWRLNSNHYGALQGSNKAQVLKDCGEKQFMAWRRAYDAPPPPLAAGSPYAQFDDPRYAALPPEARPCTESLRDVTQRLLPYWYDAIVPGLHAGACVFVVSHGNTLRALIKHLDGLSDEQVAELNIPTGMPLAYDLGPDMRPLARGGRYLDPQGPGGPASDVTGAARGPRRRPTAALIRTHDGTGAGNARL